MVCVLPQSGRRHDATTINPVSSHIPCHSAGAMGARRDLAFEAKPRGAG